MGSLLPCMTAAVPAGGGASLVDTAPAHLPATRRKAVPAVAKAAMLEGAPYPADLERIVTLSDGSVVRVRPIRPDDELRLVALFERLSPRSIYQRFFTSYRRLPASWYHEFANVDYRARLALVAEELAHDGAHVRGVVRWEPGDAPGTADVALIVEDAWQGRGLGSLLLGELLAAGAARGVRDFTADVLAENGRMLRLLRRVADVRESSVADSIVHLAFVPRATVADGDGVA
jgi:GNAT superfamily N-acetyltransferase